MGLMVFLAVTLPLGSHPLRPTLLPLGGGWLVLHVIALAVDGNPRRSISSLPVEGRVVLHVRP